MNDDFDDREERLALASDDPELLEPGPLFALDGAAIDPAQHGYTAVYNYAHYFWRPYLGNTAFALWELLLSFCYGDCDTAYPSLSRLARMLTNSDHSRAVVTGRHAGGQAAQRSCGALAVLRRERLVQVRRRGEGPTARYTFRVLKALPLLRPEQVARLSPSLRRDHATWLERYGIDAAAYQRAYEEPADGGAAPGDTPVDTTRTSVAAGARGAAPRGTNNPQEGTPMNQWWHTVLKELLLNLPRSTYYSCLAGTRPLALQDGQLTVRAPGELARQMLEGRLGKLVQRTLDEVTAGQVQAVHFVAAEAGGSEPCAR